MRCSSRSGILIRHERLDDAVKLADQLVGRAPNFAEAYNQRAIAHFLQGNSRRAPRTAGGSCSTIRITSGPWGAWRSASSSSTSAAKRIKTLRRALRLQPYSKGLREFVSSLEADGD